ncbi:unnamed protein product, partial [Polarella glacialis]
EEAFLKNTDGWRNSSCLTSIYGRDGLSQWVQNVADWCCNKYTAEKDWYIGRAEESKSITLLFVCTLHRATLQVGGGGSLKEESEQTINFLMMWCTVHPTSVVAVD